MTKQKDQLVTLGKNDVEIIARETLYSGFFSLDLYRFRHRLFNGEMSGEVRREILERGHAAVLLPYDPVRDEVVLIEQIRIAAYDTSESPWLLELVAAEQRGRLHLAGPTVMSRYEFACAVATAHGYDPGSLQSASSESSSPSRCSSTTTRPGPKRRSCRNASSAARACAASWAMTTPLPAASPSNFRTTG